MVQPEASNTEHVRPALREKSGAEKWLGGLSVKAETYEVTDPPPFGPLVVVFCFYTFIVLAMGSRLLWHDELYTFYIAKVPTLKGFIAACTQIELQPPLVYVLSRISMRIFGDGNLATRMPEMLAFTVASLCLYLFVRRRLGRFYGLAAMVVFWLAPFLQYATEARPYALVVGFLGISMLGWQAASENSKRTLGLFALAFGVWGMIVSHAFSPLLVAILGLAEIVRSLDRRRVDWPMWIALLAPTPFVMIYVPIFRRFQGWTAIPPEFQASPLKMISFYAELLSSVGPALLIAVVLALIVHRSAEPERTAESNTTGIECHELALALGLLSLPILVNLVLMRSGGAFWGRYCISAAIGFSILFVHILAKLTSASRAAAAITSGVVFLSILLGFVFQIVHPQGRAVVKQLSLKELDSRLPIVDASGLTFLEMNKREDASMMSRIFYLTDRDAALKYAHATIFENTEILQQYWHIRGTVIGYSDFVRQNQHFFVFGTPDYPEDWLIAKLIDDGAELQFKGEVGGTYKDHMVFEVTMPSSSAPLQR